MILIFLFIVSVIQKHIIIFPSLRYLYILFLPVLKHHPPYSFPSVSLTQISVFLTHSCIDTEFTYAIFL